MPTEEVLTQVEGPKGVAEVFEVTSDRAGAPEYEVRHRGKAYRYQTLGEAYIEAGTLVEAPQ